ncbi:MAG: metalloregulator ArsR/SmtB family transcription factor [Ktedonobacteraceae bacterium]|nr:metalloregulator ArsR/SmtB family transcription factor [Ktedonobacteraceae bacterium]
MSLQLPPRSAVVIRTSLEPIYNALNSFLLLTASEHLPGLNSWVVQTAAELTPELRHANRLLFEGLRDALMAEPSVQDFPSYLRRLREQDSVEMRNRVLDELRRRFSRRVSSEETLLAPDRERLLDDVQAYLTCVEYTQVDIPFDPALQTEVHALLNDASAMHMLLVSHLETLWSMFAIEWKRVQASLRWQVEMFARALDEEAALDEIFYTLTGRKLPQDVARRVDEIEEVLLVPSWHNGRYVTVWESSTNARLFFSEPPNYDVSLLHSAAMRRPELRARLGALADETRLRILELLAQRDEMPAQDIIAALELSQSSVSRHLKQLVSLGYLYERRGEGANKTYRLSSFYIDRTARALEQLVSGEEVRPEEVQNGTQPQELRRFLDRSGKLALWPPAKQRDKLLILEYLVGFFEQGRVYNEKEVNELLLLHSTVKDAAALRRALYEYRFVNRTRDGSQYWLIGSEVAEKDI